MSCAASGAVSSRPRPSKMHNRRSMLLYPFRPVGGHSVSGTRRAHEAVRAIGGGNARVCRSHSGLNAARGGMGSRPAPSHLVMPAEAGIALPFPPHLVMPAKAGIALQPSSLRRGLQGSKSFRLPAAAELLSCATVGAHPVRDARAAFKAKSGRSPSATESLSLCVAKEKVTKEKGHPAWRLPGIGQPLPALPPLRHPCRRLPGKSVSRGRAFRTGILPVRKGVDIPVDSRCAACRPRLTAAQGPR
jgi:hypothetical protein